MRVLGCCQGEPIVHILTAERRVPGVRRALRLTSHGLLAIARMRCLSGHPCRLKVIVRLAPICVDSRGPAAGARPARSPGRSQMRR